MAATLIYVRDVHPDRRSIFLLAKYLLLGTHLNRKSSHEDYSVSRSVLIPIYQIFAANVLFRSDEDVKILFTQQHYYLATKARCYCFSSCIYKQILFLFVYIEESPDSIALLCDLVYYQKSSPYWRP